MVSGKEKVVSIKLELMNMEKEKRIVMDIGVKHNIMNIHASVDGKMSPIKCEDKHVIKFTFDEHTYKLIHEVLDRYGTVTLTIDKVPDFMSDEQVREIVDTNNRRLKDEE